MFHANDGRTDMTKLIVAFRKLAKAPEKYTGTNFSRRNSLKNRCVRDGSMVLCLSVLYHPLGSVASPKQRIIIT